LATPTLQETSTHPFLWNSGALTDLGTFGGDNGRAIRLNDAGEVVGEADLPGSENHHAFLWRNGIMTDLGTLGSTSFAEWVNSKSQVVGRSRIGDPTSDLQHAFLWNRGGPMIDLNTIVPLGSDLTLIDATMINERGEIAAQAMLPNGDQRAILLIPCGEGTEGCEDAAEGRVAATQLTPAPLTPNRARLMPNGNASAWRTRLARRYHIPGLGTPKE
jgi:probable HAF family extracellular repeat protein